MKAAEVVVELYRREAFGKKKKIILAGQTVLRSDMFLHSLRSVRLPFRLNIGLVEVPSLQTSNSFVEWFVKAKLDLSKRRDPYAQTKINVWFSY